MSDNLNFPGFVFLIHTDMFLIRPLHIENVMKDYDIAYLPQSRGHVHYAADAIMVLNMKTLPDKKQINMGLGVVEGHATDVGGYMHHYFTKHPSLRKLFLTCNVGSMSTKEVIAERIKDPKLKEHLLKDAFLENNQSYSEVYFDETFLHYRSGTNWNGFPPATVDRRNRLLFEYLSSL